MGTWAHGSFDNDDAMDWADELAGAKDTEPISLAFARVLSIGDGYLEAPHAWAGLAAAEVVAALLGRPAAKLPEEITTWVKGRKPQTKAQVKEARQVVARILKDSELRDLWADSADSGLLWQKEVEDLFRRLGAPPS